MFSLALLLCIYVTRLRYTEHNVSSTHIYIVHRLVHIRMHVSLARSLFLRNKKTEDEKQKNKKQTWTLFPPHSYRVSSVFGSMNAAKFCLDSVSCSSNRFLSLSPSPYVMRMKNYPRHFTQKFLFWKAYAERPAHFNFYLFLKPDFSWGANNEGQRWSRIFQRIRCLGIFPLFARRFSFASSVSSPSQKASTNKDALNPLEVNGSGVFPLV